MASFSGPPDGVRAPMAAPNENHGGWPTKEDWIKHQRLIGQLYGRRTLAEVMSYMANEHGFRATVKMYKTRITEWGLDKKNKENEMRAIVRKKKQMGDQGKASAFRVRGRLVDYRDVARYWERKGVRIEDVIAQRSKSVTPEALKCFSAPQSPIMTPESIAVPERILVSIRDYFNGSFESGTWLMTDPRRGCMTTKVPDHWYYHLYALNKQSRIACRLFEDNHFAEGGKLLISATVRIKEILLAEDPMTLIYLLVLFAWLCRKRRYEIGLAILRQISAMAQVLEGEMHPLTCICSWLASLHQSQLEDVIVRCSGSMVNHFETILGTINWSTLVSRLIFIQKVDIKQDTSYRRFLLQDLLRQLEAALGSLDARTCELRTSLARNYSEDLGHLKAVRLGWNVAALAQRLRNPEERAYYSAEGLSIVANSQYALDKIHAAEKSICEAIRLRVSKWVHVTIVQGDGLCVWKGG